MNYFKALSLFIVISLFIGGCGLNKPTVDEVDKVPEIQMEEESEAGKAADIEKEEKTESDTPIFEEEEVIEETETHEHSE